jgi:peptide/nickel transport system substrate-binding protein
VRKILAVFAVLTTMLLLTPAVFLTTPVSAAFPSEPPPAYGPKVDRVVVKIYSNPEAEALALEAGEIDLMDWDVPADMVDDFNANPDLQMYEFDDLGMYEIDINHRVFPTSDIWFRRAVAHSLNKTWIVRDVMEGFGEELPSPVPPVLTGWANEYLTPANESKYWYYSYNVTKGYELLTTQGYYQGGDGFLHYPTTYDASVADKIVNCTLYIRQDDPYRKAAGEQIRDNLLWMNVSVFAPVVERSVCYDRVMVEYNYSLYTGGWNLGRDPDHLYDLYSGDIDTYPEPWSYNYPGFDNASYNAAVAQVKFNSTLSVCVENAWLAQQYMAEQVGIIPMFSKKGVIAGSAWWDDVINGVGGIQQSYTWALLRAHHNSTPYGGTLNWGFKSNIQSLNPIIASWVWDWQILSNIYDGMYGANPYDLSEDIASGLAQSWTVEPISLTGINGTTDGTAGLNVTFVMFENATWHDGEAVMADDVAYFYEFFQTIETPSRWVPSVQNAARVTAKSDYVVEILLNTSGYFAFHFGASPLVIPKHWWSNHLDDWRDIQPAETGELIGCGPFILTEWVPGEYVILEANKDYYRKDPLRPEYLEAELPERATRGSVQEISATISFDNVTLMNATVTLDVIEPGVGVVSRYWLENVVNTSDYEASVPMPGEVGTYSLKLTATFDIGGIVYSDTLWGAVVIEQAIDPMLLLLIGVPVSLVVGLGAGFLIFRRRPGA